MFPASRVWTIVTRKRTTWATAPAAVARSFGVSEVKEARRDSSLGAARTLGMADVGTPKTSSPPTSAVKHAAPVRTCSTADMVNLYWSAGGVAEDDAEAVKWFRKAAEQGFAKAQHILRLMYANGAEEWVRGDV